MEYIWGCDLSLSRSGITIFNAKDGCILYTMSIDTKSEKYTQMKLKKIGEELLKLKNIYMPKFVVIEKGFYRFNTSTEQIFRVHGVFNYLFYDIEQIYLQATTIKKLITGKGNAKKEEVKETILSKYKNLKLFNLDESDSAAIGLAWFIKNNVIVWNYL